MLRKSILLISLLCITSCNGDREQFRQAQEDYAEMQRSSGERCIWTIEAHWDNEVPLAARKKFFEFAFAQAPSFFESNNIPAAATAFVGTDKQEYRIEYASDCQQAESYSRIFMKYLLEAYSGASNELPSLSLSDSPRDSL